MSAIHPITTSLKSLESWMKKRRPRYLRGLAGGMAPSTLNRFERLLGLSLPADLRAWFRWRNGQKGDAMGGWEENWRPMSLEAIVATRAELLEFARKPKWRDEWLPIMDDDAGNYRFVDLSKDTAPVMEFHAGTSKPIKVTGSFRDWLLTYAADARNNKYIEDPERGTFMRKSPASPV